MSITSSKTQRVGKKCRLVFLGDLSVGKSSIIERYTLNKFDDGVNSTVGIDFTLKDITRYGKLFRLQMWDTAGSQRYRSLIPTYLKNAQCVLLIFDVTNIVSFNNISMWSRMFKQYQDAPGFIVGNKIDLIHERKIDSKTGQQLAEKLGWKYIEVSAKTNKKLDQLFCSVIDTIVEQSKNENLQSTTVINDEQCLTSAKKQQKPKVSGQKKTMKSKCC